MGASVGPRLKDATTDADPMNANRQRSAVGPAIHRASGDSYSDDPDGWDDEFDPQGSPLELEPWDDDEGEPEPGDFWLEPHEWDE